jgi:hypothetical protein
LGVETLIHEAGSGQMEINFTHGDPLELAGRVFLFKRAVRGTALRHGIVFAPSRSLNMAPATASSARGSANTCCCSSEHVMHKEFISFVRVFREARKIHFPLFIFPV